MCVYIELNICNMNDVKFLLDFVWIYDVGKVLLSYISIV